MKLLFGYALRSNRKTCKYAHRSQSYPKLESKIKFYAAWTCQLTLDLDVHSLLLNNNTEVEVTEPQHTVKPRHQVCRKHGTNIMLQIWHWT